MTPIQSHPSDHAPDGAELFNAQPAHGDTVPREVHGPGFGSRLRAARKARGLDLEACANTLRLPARVLRKLELDQYDGTDSKVYLSSYIATYGCYLGIDEDAIQAEVHRIRQVETPLVTSGGISHSRFLLDRYVTAATYVVLTLVIAVPTLWFGVRSTLDRDIMHLAPLDATPVVQQDLSKANRGTTAGVDHASQPAQTPAADAANANEEQPLMASMAPFPSLSGNNSLLPPEPDAALAAERDGHRLELTLSESSWVEVTQADGTRLEYGLLSAGSHKVYHSDQALDVNIGNVSGAQVEIDGQAVGLDDFRRANVAHFRMQLQDGKASPASL